MGTVTAKVTDASGNIATASASYTVGPTAHVLPDFGSNPAQPGVALWQKSGTFIQGGVNADTYSQVPNSTTKTDGTPATTPWFLMMFGGGSSSAVATDLEVAGFSLIGVPQSPLTRYHGLRIAYSTGAKIHDVLVKGTPGTASSPPGETFHMPTWHADNMVITDVTLDGRDANGAGNSATLWGATACASSTVTRLKANYSQNGFGMSLFNCSGNHVITDSDFRFNRKAVNIEKSFGGTIRFVRCDFRGTFGSSYIAQVSAAAANVSTVVTFEDCIFDNDKCVVNCYASPGPNGTNGQHDSDITRVINGVTYVDGQDPAKFVITHV